MVTHGSWWSTVEPGPLLPAEAATKTPEEAALKNAIETASTNSTVPRLPMEKLMTSTPSATAASMPATRSAPAQPPQQTL